MKILIADDKESTRFMLRKYLNDWGEKPVEAADGDHAWELLNHEEPPRIAILDWMMPGLNGVEICRKLTTREKAPLVYSILLTTREGQDDLVHALDNGAHSFQSKPISPAELKSHINVGKRLVTSNDKLIEYSQEMEALAQKDILTGFGNRRFFFQLGAHFVNVAQRHGTPFSVIMMDLDRFKRINDTWGHRAGDAALENFADLVRACVREVDIPGRIGGEEFAILLPDTGTESAYRIAERIRRRVENLLVRHNENDIRFTVSTGISCYDKGDDSIAPLLERADSALYRAKREGRNRTLISSNQAR